MTYDYPLKPLSLMIHHARVHLLIKKQVANDVSRRTVVNDVNSLMMQPSVSKTVGTLHC